MTDPIPLSLSGVDDFPLRGWRYAPESRSKSQAGATAILLLHGFANDARIWDPIARQLADRHPVYALDFRGHGDSGWDPAARYDHWTLAADLDRAISGLRLPQPFVLIGHSLGARVGLLYQQRYCPALAGLVILDTGPEIGAAGVARVRRDAEAMPDRFPSPEDYLAWLRRSYVMAEPAALASWARLNLRRLPTGEWQPKTDPGFTRSLWKASQRRGDASDLVAPLDAALIEALQAVECPTLLLRGQLSAILRRRSAERMVKEWLADGRLVTVAAAGHALPVDQPLTVASALADFLADISPASATAAVPAMLPLP